MPLEAGRSRPGRLDGRTALGAVIGPTKTIAADFAGQGIHCNAICPGTVYTASLHDRPAATGDHDAAWAAFVAW